MNILFVLSQVELTGAETYAASLIERLKAKGHSVTIVSDTLTCSIEAPYYSLDLDNRKSLLNRIKHIRSLSRIIKQEGIDIVHAHSRASSWAAYFASRINRIPLVTTAHGIYPVHPSRRLMPCFGEKIIAVCGAVRDHLIRDLGVEKGDISLIPNGIDVQYFRPGIDTAALREELDIQSGTRVISWIGRFSGPRGRLIEKMVERVFPEVLTSLPNLRLLIVAGGDRPVSLEKRVKAVNQQFTEESPSSHPSPRSGEGVMSEPIRFTGLRKDIPQICNLSDLIIGAGRVALEAMSCGCPVIALGENKLVGLLTPESLQDGMYTNFGDCCQRQAVDWQGLTKGITDLLKNRDRSDNLSEWGRKIVVDQFDLERVVERVEGVYFDARAE